MLESLAAKCVAVLIALVLLVGGAWKLYHDIDNSGYERGVAEQKEADRVAAEKQRNENLIALGDASKRADDAGRRFQKLIEGTKNELPKSTENLVSCRLEPDAVRVLNTAASAATSKD
jgi:hypothetical protein